MDVEDISLSATVATKEDSPAPDSNSDRPKNYNAKLKGRILAHWVLAKVKGRTPNIDSIFDTLELDESQRYEFLKWNLAIDLNSREMRLPVGYRQQRSCKQSAPLTNKEMIMIRFGEQHFKVGHRRSLRKAMINYCEVHQKELSQYTFVFQGKTIQPTDSPWALGIVDEDTIEAHEQDLVDLIVKSEN